MAEADRVRMNIAAYWNAISATYDDEPDHRIRGDAEHAAWLAALHDLLPAPPAVVLDVGTGTGFLALLLAELGYAVLGVDLAEQMLAIARAKASSLTRPPTFVAGDAAAPPVAHSSMDGIVSRHLLWTLPDPSRALRNWWHVLRPGGWLVIIDGLWSVGTPTAPTSTPTLAERVYPTYYTPEVTARLPLLRTTRLDAIVKTITDTGFREAQVVRVGAVACPTPVDAGTGQAHPGRYVITAGRPA